MEAIVDSGKFSPLLNRHVVRWSAVAPFRSAKFVFPARPCYYEIVHPSTENIGAWRVSRFDDQGAIGHVEIESAQEALCWVTSGAVLETVNT